jgi:RHS repeat-associated protein
LWLTWTPPGSVIQGDFNGDGRADLASWNSSTGVWQVAESTGSAFTTMTWSTFATTTLDSGTGNYYHRGVTANYGYDNAGRLTTLTYQQIGGAGSSLATYAYAYDLGNRLTSETLNNGTPTSYGYDTTNQLTTVTNASGTTTYGYDLNGNRTNTGYVTGSENQLTADATYSYTYDAEGNQITKTNKSTLEQWTFGYDNLNHMTSAIDKNSSGTTLTYATYMYDVFGNRIEKDVWTQSGGSTTTTHMAYDGASIWADLSSGNALLARYLHSDQIDNLIARIVTSGSTPTASWYLPDRLGSIRNITDANGNPIDTITYDGFGNVTNETTSANGDRWKFTGREFDSETGLQFNRARYYNAADGRWTGQDPIGFGAGDPNLYWYVHNNTLLFVDPFGLRKIDVKMDAFINKRTGVWLPEPVPFSSWFFKGNDRDFGGPFEESKVRSWFTIDSKDIGHSGQVEVQHAGTISERRKVTTFWNFFPVSWYEGWVYEAKDAPAEGSSETANGTNGKCSTRVTVDAYGRYPFYPAWMTPAIDYRFLIYFIITGPNTIVTKIGYNHNQFPDYEVRIDDEVSYKYATPDAGPGWWNLAWGPNEKGVQDGPTINAKTNCCE